MVLIGFNQEKWHFLTNFCHCQGLYFRDVLVPLILRVWHKFLHLDFIINFDIHYDSNNPISLPNYIDDSFWLCCGVTKKI